MNKIFTVHIAARGRHNSEISDTVIARTPKAALLAVIGNIADDDAEFWQSARLEISVYETTQAKIL